MGSMLLVLGGVLVGLLLLLALIVGLSARPATRTRPDLPSPRSPRVADAGRPRPEAWSGPAASARELPAVR